jgi:predicted HAD superfamily Cof-like phosphohydrolase
MTNVFKDVRDFNKKFGLPYAGEDQWRDPPRLLSDDVFKYRLAFLQEEIQELVEAQANGDLEGAADALADLVYVAVGTAHLMRVPLDEVWQEVQRSNMEKVRADGAGDPRSTRGHALDVVKPEGWQPPDIAGVLRRHGVVGAPQ